MKTTKLAKLVTVLLILTSVFAGHLDAVKAQSGETDNKISFSTLDQNEISLQGPLDTKSFTFLIPAEWKMLSGGQLHMEFAAFFDYGDASTTGDVASTAGYLQVSVNGISIGTITVNQRGENSVDIPIPATVWAQADPNASSDVEFSLRTPGPCNTAFLNSGNVVGGLSLTIHPSSYFLMPYSTIPLTADLRQLPYPIFQDSFLPESALLVIPDQPTEKELQASLVAAAAFGRLSNGLLDLQTTTVGKLDPARLSDSHLIFVGLPSAFPQLAQASWPAKVTSQGVGSGEAGADDGVVQAVVSPYNTSKIWLLVTGNNDEGVSKAAKALTNGKNIRVSTNPALSIVTDAQPFVSAATDKIDSTFADLGYGNQDSQGPGIRYTEYLFNVPSGAMVEAGAYLNLVYAHSAMLDFDGAGISVLLNGDYIGSLRFSAQDAQVSTWRLNLPTSSFVPGENRLLISANLVPVSSCITTNQLWFTSRSDSELYLPLGVAVAEETKLLLRRYPSPFFPDLDHTAVIVSKSDPASWEVASKIAFDLGGKIRGSVSDPVVAFADSIPDTLRTERDLLIIGRPSQIPLMQDLALNMPASFEQGSDIAKEPAQGTIYSVPSDVPVGYLQVFASPWDANRSILAINGNSDEGLKLAADALVISEQFSQVAGNLTVVYQNQIIPVQVTTDKTVLLGTPAAVASESAPIAETPAASQPAASSATMNIVVAVVLLIFGVLVIGFIAWQIMSKRGSGKA